MQIRNEAKKVKFNGPKKSKFKRDLQLEVYLIFWILIIFFSSEVSHSGKMQCREIGMIKISEATEVVRKNVVGVK